MYKIASGAFLNCSTLTNQSFNQPISESVDGKCEKLGTVCRYLPIFTFLTGDIIFETNILQKNHLKGKVHPRTGHKGPERGGGRGIALLFP